MKCPKCRAKAAKQDRTNMLDDAVYYKCTECGITFKTVAGDRLMSAKGILIFIGSSIVSGFLPMVLAIVLMSVVFLYLMQWAYTPVIINSARSERNA